MKESDKLCIGCGIHAMKGFINVDIGPFQGVDVVHDLNVVPYPFKSNSFRLVVGHHVLEHLTDVTQVMDELYRICKDKAEVIITVPYYHSQGAFQDITHKHFFAVTSFDYFSDKWVHKYTDSQFRVKKVRMIPTRLGKCFPPSLRHWASLVFGEIIRELTFELEVVKRK